MSEVVYENQSAVLRYHPVEKIVHHEFLKRPQGADFRDLLSAGYELIVKHHATKWLSDDRNNSSVLDEADEAWARGVWFERMQKAGWLYWAIVNPQKVVGRMQLKRHATGYKLGGVTVENFDTPTLALTWLKGCDVNRKAG